MDSNLAFSTSIYVEQESREDEELSAFTKVVASEFGLQQALLAGLTESESMDTPPGSVGRNRRAVSIAASFRLVADQGGLEHLRFDVDL